MPAPLPNPQPCAPANPTANPDMHNSQAKVASASALSKTSTILNQKETNLSHPPCPQTPNPFPRPTTHKKNHPPPTPYNQLPPPPAHPTSNQPPPPTPPNKHNTASTDRRHLTTMPAPSEPSPPPCQPSPRVPSPWECRAPPCWVPPQTPKHPGPQSRLNKQATISTDRLCISAPPPP